MSDGMQVQESTLESIQGGVRLFAPHESLLKSALGGNKLPPPTLYRLISGCFNSAIPAPKTGDFPLSIAGTDGQTWAEGNASFPASPAERSLRLWPKYLSCAIHREVVVDSANNYDITFSLDSNLYPSYSGSVPDGNGGTLPITTWDPAFNTYMDGNPTNLSHRVSDAEVIDFYTVNPPPPWTIHAGDDGLSTSIRSGSLDVATYWARLTAQMEAVEFPASFEDGGFAFSLRCFCSTVFAQNEPAEYYDWLPQAVVNLTRPLEQDGRVAVTDSNASPLWGAVWTMATAANGWTLWAQWRGQTKISPGLRPPYVILRERWSNTGGDGTTNYATTTPGTGSINTGGRAPSGWIGQTVMVMKRELISNGTIGPEQIIGPAGTGESVELPIPTSAPGDSMPGGSLAALLDGDQYFVLIGSDAQYVLDHQSALIGEWLVEYTG